MSLKQHCIQWLAVCAFALAAMALPVWMDGGPNEAEAAADVAASLHDALAQAQAESPDLWDEASRQRARLAAELIASGRAQP